MKSQDKLKQLTKSIRLTNQAKMLGQDIKKLTRLIEKLQETRLIWKVRAMEFVREAHSIQREVIPVQTMPTKRIKIQSRVKPNQEKIDENTLVKIFGEEEAARLAKLAQSEKLES